MVPEGEQQANKTRVPRITHFLTRTRNLPEKQAVRFIL